MKRMLVLLLLFPLILATGKIAFSVDSVLPNHPPETEEERKAIEKQALEIALSDERVKRLIETKACNYTLQSNAVTSFHAEFISKEQIGTDPSRSTPVYKEMYRYVWDGNLKATVVFIYDDYSKYFLHVDVTNGEIEYIGYIKWDWIDPITHIPNSTEPLEWINIFYNGRAQNLIEKEVSQNTIKHLQEVWNVHTILPFDGTIIYPPES